MAAEVCNHLAQQCHLPTAPGHARASAHHDAKLKATQNAHKHTQHLHVTPQLAICECLGEAMFLLLPGALHIHHHPASDGVAQPMQEGIQIQESAKASFKWLKGLDLCVWEVLYKESTICSRTYRDEFVQYLSKFSIMLAHRS